MVLLNRDQAVDWFTLLQIKVLSPRTRRKRQTVNQLGASVYFSKQKNNVLNSDPTSEFLRHVVKGCVPNISKEFATLLQITSTLIAEEISAVESSAT
jgi:hypothetical protein